MLVFYRDLLGEPQRLVPEKWASFSCGGTRLVLWAASPRPQTAGGALQLCLEVADLDAALASLSARAICSAIQVASHGREFFLNDPDGNELIVYQPNPPNHVD